MPTYKVIRQPYNTNLVGDWRSVVMVANATFSSRVGCEARRSLLDAYCNHRRCRHGRAQTNTAPFKRRPSRETPVEKLTLIDIVAAEPPKGFAGSVDTLAADISTMETAQKIVSGRPDVIFHLAAIVSGEAELDFDKGYRINLMAPAICSMRSGLHTLLTAISLAWFSHRPLPFWCSAPLPDP